MPVTIGSRAQVSKQFTDVDAILFKQISLDANPVHFNDVYAAENTPWPGRVMQGMAVASLISGLLANELPGPGTILLGFDKFRFKRPVFPEDTVFAEAVVESIGEMKGTRQMVVLHVTLVNQKNELVIECDVSVLAPVTVH